MIKLLFLLLATAATVSCVNDTTETVEVTSGNRLVIENQVPEMTSVGVMAFGPDNALLVADPMSGTLFAFEIDRGRAPLSLVPFNILYVDVQMAVLLGTTVDQINIKDMVVHPISHRAYLSVMVGDGDGAQPAVFNVNNEGVIELVDLAAVSYTAVTLDQLPDEAAVVGNNISLRELSMTDIDYFEGELFVSGLSNGEFSAVVHRMPYPFDGTVSTASTEIYHTTHDQIETRAPIRTQTIIETESGPILLAAYAGTPLVTFPLSDMSDGAVVRGKTVAELGYGSTPIDLLFYSEFGTDKIIATQTNYNALTFEVDQILAANSSEGLSAPVAPGTIEGIEPFNTALSGVDQISELDSVHLLMVRTNRESGNLDLVSTVKSIFFRLSDFQSEYDAVGYNYPDDGSQRATKMFHNIFRLNEGHREEVVFP
ncbi:MAG: hypothetical protein AAF633_20125 [Chloroflexota bacterium]